MGYNRNIERARRTPRVSKLYYEKATEIIFDGKPAMIKTTKMMKRTQFGPVYVNNHHVDIIGSEPFAGFDLTEEQRQHNWNNHLRYLGDDGLRMYGKCKSCGKKIHRCPVGGRH
jgi:hypothetical protein